MRWSGCPVHQLSTHGSRCRKCGGAPHGWCGSSSCEEDRNPQPTFLGLNLNLKMVWRAVKLATGRFHFFHWSSGSLGSPGVLGVPESWESRESRSLGSLGSPGVLGVSGVPESQTVNCNFANTVKFFIFLYFRGSENLFNVIYFFVLFLYF